MVKNKALPDSARPCCNPVWSLSLSLPRRLGPIKAGLTCLLSLSLSLSNAIHPEGTPWILQRLDSGI